MRFGVNTWVWTSPLSTRELERLASHVSQLGFDWIEVPIENLEDLDWERSAAILRDHQLGISAAAVMSSERDLIHPDPEIRANGMDYLRQAIEASHALGAIHLVGPLYSATGRTWQSTEDDRSRDLDLLVKNLSDLSVYASDKGVTLCLEPLNRFETSFINLADQVIEVVDRVGNPSCQIMLDTFHMNIEEKSLGNAIRAAGERLKHVHACENDRGAPGTGNINWREVAQALKDIQYDGPLVIESFTANVKSIARAAAIWRRLAPTQDSLAADGLRFLKQLVG